MRFRWNQVQVRGALALVALCAPMLTACAKPDASAAAVKAVPVPIHGVNYSAEPFSFVVIDPQDTKNNGGGETINAYGAGGTMCCYSLPPQWRPGLKVEIAEIYWLPMKADQSVPEVRKKHVVEVPRYQSGKAGELWVLRGTGGEMNVVSSDFQPDHKNWPGKVKGWPVPSIEYQRKLHDQSIAEAQSTVDLYVRLLDKLSQDPGKRTLEAWNSSMLHHPESLKPFEGPDDPTYLAMLKKDYANELASARDDLGNKKAARP